MPFNTLGCLLGRLWMFHSGSAAEIGGSHEQRPRRECAVPPSGATLATCAPSGSWWRLQWGQPTRPGNAASHGGQPVAGGRYGRTSKSLKLIIRWHSRDQPDRTKKCCWPALVSLPSQQSGQDCDDDDKCQPKLSAPGSCLHIHKARCGRNDGCHCK